MTQSKPGYIFDVNVLVALIDDSHVHHDLVKKWFESIDGLPWGVCAFTEAGFARVMTKPATGILTIEEVTEILERLAILPGYRFWSMTEGWGPAAARFRGKIFGHQQVTDALLLSLAVKEGGVLVTFDRGLKFLAGAEFRNNLLILD